jgi:hypothetical protein
VAQNLQSSRRSAASPRHLGFDAPEFLLDILRMDAEVIR